MGALIAGIAIFAATLGIFAYCLPRAGRSVRFLDTQLEPYIAVALCAGFALGVTMILSSILGMIG